MLKQLDPLLHNELRLKIVSILVGVESAEFKFLAEETKASKGNLSAQITKLANANYIKVEKTFRDNYPLTTCIITKDGKKAFESYAKAIQDYFKNI